MFINTLAAFFVFTSLISPIEAALMLLITAYIVYLLTPAQLTDHLILQEFKGIDFYMYLQAAWLGRLPLLPVFLPFFIILNGALFYADYRSDAGTYTIASWLTILVILALPLFWWTISVWRCSLHANRIWATMARFVIVAVYYEYILRLLIGYYYPQIWFNCQQLIIEYGDCI
ncbi:MAG: hypothetical protein HON51_04325 [Gammaproteobacteria bacterium]|jgi:hypothetical protein|nr:hypothetical protein [Gammaproteobacteria bacterium]MBT5825337.1 hypothetical protein [Gammaproteobacteria bacterium]MBT5966570.1 hypothetical protein [Gammaproteobacteria bacterium]MBT6420687.1 hypothetical protein [Gammaproteobacteria bacterium]MBT6575454.1 hypothetical protein [Gammaproteobacteria bacterium]